MGLLLMTVIVIESAPDSLRGELTRWLLETKPGVFVGNTNKMVRELLWEKIANHPQKLNAIVIYSANNEQGFAMLMTGEPYRSVIDFDGIQLIRIKS